MQERGSTVANSPSQKVLHHGKPSHTPKVPRCQRGRYSTAIPHDTEEGSRPFSLTDADLGPAACDGCVRRWSNGSPLVVRWSDIRRNAERGRMMVRVQCAPCCRHSECLPRWPPTDDKEPSPKRRLRKTLRAQQFFSWPNDSPQQVELIPFQNETADARTSAGRSSL